MSIDKITYKGYAFKINSKGYYSNYILGDLHRVKFQSEHNIIVPKGYVVHHKDENPKNNDLDNLEMITILEHTILHKTGKKMSEETKKKLSDALKGRVVPQHVRDKISATEKGRIFSEETKAKISAAKTKEITEEMEQDVREGMALKNFEAKYGYGRVIWEKIKRSNNLMKSNNFREVTEEMRQDVINGIALKEFATKYNSSGTLFYRIKKEEGIALFKGSVATEEMINDVINNKMPRRTFQEKYKAPQTLWNKIRKNHL